MTRCRFSLSVITLWALAVLGGCNRDRARAGEADEGRVVAVDKLRSPSRAKSPAGETRGGARGVAKTKGAAAVAGVESAGANEDTSGSFTISGRVTLRGGGAASGAVVRVARFDFVERLPVMTDVASTTAGNDGRYRVRLEAVATYSVTASRPGSVPAVVSAKSFSGMDRSFQADLVLEPASYVRGRVVAEGERPVAGARVRWVTHNDNPTAPLTDDSMATVTLGDGGLALESVPEGELLLAVVSDHHVVTTQTVFAPAENVVIRMASEGARIGGGVYHHATREGIAGATVTLTLRGGYSGRMGIDPITVVTDPVGAFSMERLPAGTWTIAAGKEKLGMVLPGSEGASAATLTLGDRESTSGLRLFLYAGHTVQGVVRDKLTSEPIAGVRVWRDVVGEGKEKGVVTDGLGRYELPGVFGHGADVVGLKAEKKGCFLESLDALHQDIKVPIRPDRLVAHKDLVMLRMVRVTGTVKTESEVPVEKAKVMLYRSSFFGGTDSSSYTDEDGKYELEAGPYGQVRVQAEARGYPVAYSDLVEVDDRSVVIDIVVKSGAAVTGRVVDWNDSPVADAEVRAFGVVSMGGNGITVPQGEVQSGADGSFSFSDLMPDQEIMIISNRTGYVESPMERLVLKPGERRSDIKLVLRKSSFLAGTVTDDAGVPVEGVTMTATGNDGGYSIPEVRTDNRGRYRLEGLMEGTRGVTASHDGWQETRGAKTGREDVNFVIPRKAEQGVVIGRVVDAKTRAPVRDFTIASAGGLAIETRGQEPGTFIGKGLDSGKRYRVTIVAEGYLDQTSEYFSLPEGMLTVEKIFEMGPGGSVTGRVVETGIKVPLAGVRIVLKAGEERWRALTQNPTATAVTDGEGRFQLEGLEAGSSRVFFRPDKPLVQKDATVTVTHGEVTDMGDVELGAGGTIRGRLIRMPGEIPVTDTWIQLTETNSLLSRFPGMKTGAGGEFEFTGLPASNYSVRAVDYNVSRQLTLADGATQEVVLRTGGGVLKGSVLRGDEPVGGVSFNMTLHGSSDDVRHAQSDVQGKFTVEGLLAGKWSVSVRRQIDGNDLSGLDEIEIVEGETAEKVFRLSYGLMRGRVTDAEGKPVSGARIVFPVSGAANNQPRPANKDSAHDGTWSMNGVKPGRYTVVATKKGYSPSDPVTVEVPAEGESAEAVLVLRDVSDGGTLVSATYRITDGGPLQIAWTKLRRTDGTELDHGTARDFEGVMKIEGIPPGTYNVEVSAWGYSVSNHPALVIEAGKTVRLEDVLHDCGSLDWRLVDKGGSALKDVPVRLVPDDALSIEPVREGQTDFAGTYSTRGITPGRYTATATPPGKAPVTLPVVIVAHEGVEQTTVVD